MERFRETIRERQFRVVSKNRFTPTFLSAVQIGLVALFQCSGYNHARQPGRHRVSGVGLSSPRQAPVIKTHSEPVLVSTEQLLCACERAGWWVARSAHCCCLFIVISCAIHCESWRAMGRIWDDERLCVCERCQQNMNYLSRLPFI